VLASAAVSLELAAETAQSAVEYSAQNMGDSGNQLADFMRVVTYNGMDGMERRLSPNEPAQRGHVGCRNGSCCLDLLNTRRIEYDTIFDALSLR
jgi:hypothetical protein